MREKEACVLSLSLTLVLKCPCTIPNSAGDRSLSSVIYLINNAHMVEAVTLDQSTGCEENCKNGHLRCV